METENKDQSQMHPDCFIADFTKDAASWSEILKKGLSLRKSAGLGFRRVCIEFCHIFLHIEALITGIVLYLDIYIASLTA